VLAAVNRGRPLRLEAANSPALVDIDNLAIKLLGRNHKAQPKAGNSTMFGRVARKLGLK